MGFPVAGPPLVVTHAPSLRVERIHFDSQKMREKSNMVREVTTGPQENILPNIYALRDVEEEEVRSRDDALATFLRYT